MCPLFTGRSYDKNGNRFDWWSNSSAQAFTERAQCLIDQYSGFTFPEYGVSVSTIN